MLRESAGRFFAESDAAQALRRHRNARELVAQARGQWDGMTALGLTGGLVPEAFGGAGLGYRECVQVSEMIGRSLATGPFLSTAVMAATAIVEGDNPRIKQAMLPAIASGEMVVAIATEERARHDPLAIDARAQRTGGGFRVSGRKRAVIDGNIAQKLIVAARDAEEPETLLLLGDLEEPRGLLRALLRRRVFSLGDH